jgi:hypothetical protein
VERVSVTRQVVSNSFTRRCERMYTPAPSCSVHSNTRLHCKFSDRQLPGDLISRENAPIHLRTIQVSDCNLRVNLYAAGGWAGLSQTEKHSILIYGEEFRRQLAPLMSSAIGHGGFIMPCLVHCVTGYAFWLNGRIEGIAPYAAFWRWFVYGTRALAVFTFLPHVPLSGMSVTAAYGLWTHVQSLLATLLAFICVGDIHDLVISTEADAFT